MTADGSAKPGGGTISVFEPPTGPGVRVDSYGYAGYRTNPNFDSLLAKVIVHARELRRGRGARRSGRWRPSGWTARRATSASCARCWPTRRCAPTRSIRASSTSMRPKLIGPRRSSAAPAATTVTRQAGAKVDAVDPLAVLSVRQGAERSPSLPKPEAPEGTVPVPAPMQGTIVSLSVKEGDAVAAGQPLLIMDAMKMQHEIKSPARGYVRRIAVEAGRDDLRRPCAAVRRGGRCRGEGRGGRGRRSISTISGPTSPSISSAAP